MAKVSEINTETMIVKNEHGEVIKHETTESFKYKITQKEPMFVKMYLDDIDLYSGLSDKESTIMLNLLKMTTYEDNEISLSAGKKKELGRKLNVTNNYIDKTLSKLCKKNLFIRRDTGIYKLNPYIFGYGSWDKISKLRMIVEYDENGRSFKLEESPVCTTQREIVKE